jgi:hypothetical protein
MQDAHKFEIRVPGFHASVDESKRVKGAPASDLPPISEEEREFARKFGMSDEAYRREKLAGIYGQQRMEARALDLGTQVEEILAALGSEYRLASVTWNSDTLTWRLEIKTPRGEQNVVLSWELVDDSLDFRTKSELQRLRNMVLFGLGRQELIVKH